MSQGAKLSSVYIFIFSSSSFKPKSKDCFISHHLFIEERRCASGLARDASKPTHVPYVIKITALVLFKPECLSIQPNHLQRLQPFHI